MRGRNKQWDPWADSSLDRRDFRDSKGDGPEEMPHRKAGRKKGKGTKRGDHKHIYIWTTIDGFWDTYVYTRWNGRKFIYEHQICCEWTCQKKGRSRLKYLD